MASIGEPSFLAITTGFCGACTTFATWQAFATKRYVNLGEWTPTGIIDAVLILTVHLPLYMVCVRLGETVLTPPAALPAVADSATPKPEAASSFEAIDEGGIDRRNHPSHR
jgi:hypothetical protein